MRLIAIISICVLLAGCDDSSTQVSSPPAGAAGSAANPAASSSGAPEEGSAAAQPQEAATATPAGTASQPAGGAAAAPSGLTPVPVDSGIAMLAPENSRIQFVGTHVGDKPDPRTGVFHKFSGKAEVDAAAKALKSVTLEISTESLETPISKLTNHLRSADFFDAREFPTAKFQTTSITPPDASGKAQVTGNLTLLKATRELKIPATIRVTDQGLTLHAEFTIDRTEFGMSALQDRVNKEVAMTVTIGRPTSAK
jgi:polyisoprenoid-binding protein YceI